MRRDGLFLERQSVMLNERRKWSVTWRSSAAQFEGMRPEQQIKSRVCPLVWVGKSMNSMKSEVQNSQDRRRSLWWEEDYSSPCVCWKPHINITAFTQPGSMTEYDEKRSALGLWPGHRLFLQSPLSRKQQLGGTRDGGLCRPLPKNNMGVNEESTLHTNNSVLWENSGSPVQSFLAQSLGNLRWFIVCSIPALRWARRHGFGSSVLRFYWSHLVLVSSSVLGDPQQPYFGFVSIPNAPLPSMNNWKSGRGVIGGTQPNDNVLDNVHLEGQHCVKVSVLPSMYIYIYIHPHIGYLGYRCNCSTAQCSGA